VLVFFSGSGSISGIGSGSGVQFQRASHR
jgi:hypothetical protein